MQFSRNKAFARFLEKALFTRNVCVCVKCQEWVLWQQVMMQSIILRLQLTFAFLRIRRQISKKMQRQTLRVNGPLKLRPSTTNQISLLKIYQNFHCLHLQFLPSSHEHQTFLQVGVESRSLCIYNISHDRENNCEMTVIRDTLFT